MTIEKEVANRTTFSLSLLNVRGEHLIRALDVNLPQPIALSYPIFDSTGSTFDGGYYAVDSFSTWQFTRTLTCPWPPCRVPREALASVCSLTINSHQLKDSKGA